MLEQIQIAQRQGFAAIGYRRAVVGLVAVRIMKGSLSISEYPGDIVRLSCEKCGRSGQYRKRNLIERYGADMRCLTCAERLRSVIAWKESSTLAWFVTLI